jgi:hypothetical protein
MTTDATSTGTVATARRPRPAPRREAKPAVNSTEKAAKESPGEELLHEIFRTQGMDLRESARTRGLVSDLFKALKGGGK